MKLRFSLAAIADAESIREFIATDNPDAAGRVIERIADTIEILRDFPRLGRTGMVEETFELLVPGLPYVVIYQQDTSPEEGITILRIYHVARDRGNRD